MQAHAALPDVSEELPLTCGERFWSWFAVLLWGVMLVPCFVVWLISLVLRAAGRRMAKGLGARLLHTEAYDDLHCSVYTCCAKKGWDWSFIPSEVFQGLDLLLTDPVRKCWTEALNVIIIVSGLLTTSSYQAMYSSFANSPSGGDNSTATFSSISQQDSVVTVQAVFRMANTVSFLASLVTIVVSALIILALQKFATVTSADDAARHGQRYDTLGPEWRILTKWSQALMYLGYRLAVYAFFTSLVAALLAVGLAAYAMFENVYSNWADSVVAWAFLAVSLILVFVGMLVSTIKSEPAPQSDSELARLSAVQAEGAAEPPATPAASPVYAGRIKGARIPPEVQAMGDEMYRSDQSPRYTAAPSAATPRGIPEQDAQLQLLQKLLEAQQGSVGVMKQMQQESVVVMKQLQQESVDVMKQLLHVHESGKDLPAEVKHLAWGASQGG